MKMDCEHQTFEAAVDVNRLGDGKGQIVAYSADLRVKCSECGEDFRFIGVPCGLLPDQPTMSATAKELHIPIRPASSDSDFGLAIPGFRLKLSSN